MKLKNAKQQTLFLTGTNAVVRAIGMLMRIWISRLLGSEVLGVMELAQSVHMVAIAPLTSGLSSAISRLTAISEREQQNRPLFTGLWLSRITAAVLIPALWLLSPCLSRIMGDTRVLPSLWFIAPCILILGYSASYNGYCYGIGRSELPAFSEFIEQATRFALTCFLIKRAIHMTVPWLAAIPVASTMLAEIAGLIFVILRLPQAKNSMPLSASSTKAVFSLAAPTAVSRLVQTLLRSVTAILIPLRLQASGLSAPEATAGLGMLNGMVAPVLMLPGVFTSALSMVMLPKMARAEEKPSELGRLVRISLLYTVPLSLVCGGMIYACAPFAANTIYRQPDLMVLFRRCAFQVILFPLVHMLGSTLSALGLQKRSMYISSMSAVILLVLTWKYAGMPSMRLNGVIHAQYISLLFTLTASALTLAVHRRQIRSGDKSV